jgi:hypothetical protein
MSDVAGEGDAGTRTDGPEEGEGYSGVLGTYPFAFRHSDSRLFRSYALVGGLLAALVALIFVSAFVQLVANTLGTAGGTFTFVRSFYILLGLLVVVPLMAPVLLVARRHRRTGSTLAYDRALAAGGYLFVFSLYVGGVAAAPPELRDAPPAAVAPVVNVLYGLPPVAGAIPPLAALAVGYLLHRRYR